MSRMDDGLRSKFLINSEETEDVEKITSNNQYV